jgi:hypothetical protein
MDDVGSSELDGADQISPRHLTHPEHSPLNEQIESTVSGRCGLRWAIREDSASSP